MGDLDESTARQGFSTRAIHAGQDPEPTTGAVVTPISLSTTFAQEGVGGHKGFEYSRSGNPTRSALEAQVSSLEDAAHGLAFASGLAAEDNILRLLRPGQRILLGNDAYGGTFRLISKVWSPLGFPWTAVDLTDLDALRNDWPDDVGMVWLETPTNPLLTCFDIEAIAEIAVFTAALWAAGWRLGETFPHGADLAAASGGAFATVVVMQMANSFACRSTRLPAWRLPWMGNRFLLVAVATSSAAIVFTAPGGIIGYIVNGLDVPGRLPYSIGYVNLAIGLALMALSIPMAQLGARAAHSIDARKLRLLFVVLMVYTGLRMTGLLDLL